MNSSNRDNSKISGEKADGENLEKKEAVLERLDKLEAMIMNNKRRGTRLCWIRWTESSKYGYEIDSAMEDVAWLIHEVRRLRGENKELHDFAREFRRTLDSEIEWRSAKPQAE